MASRQEKRDLATKSWLDETLSTYHRQDYLRFDPLSLAHRYSAAEDQEVVGLLAALFSFGNVKSIISSTERLLAPLGSHPAKVLREELRESDIRDLTRSLYYRFYTASDIAFLLRRLQRILQNSPTLESAFVKSWTGEMISSLAEFRKLFLPTREKEITPGLKFMFADPLTGTAKRWHMYLRWMIRRDDVDLGLWTQVSPAHLIQPLDTHLYQVGRHLQLTSRKSLCLAAALEMTERFRKWDPSDPIKYDFALCRLGVLGELPKALEKLSDSWKISRNPLK